MARTRRRQPHFFVPIKSPTDRLTACGADSDICDEDLVYSVSNIQKASKASSNSDWSDSGGNQYLAPLTASFPKEKLTTALIIKPSVSLEAARRTFRSD